MSDPIELSEFELTQLAAGRLALMVSDLVPFQTPDEGDIISWLDDEEFDVISLLERSKDDLERVLTLLRVRKKARLTGG